MQTIDGGHDEPLTNSLSPLLMSMRLSGLYFHIPIVKTETGGAAAVKNSRVGTSDSIANGSKPPLSQRISMIYSTVILVIVWLNAVRVLTAITPDDKSFFVITNKLMIISWNIQCAVQMTTYFIACRTGRLHRVLDDIRLKTASCNIYTRRLATKFALSAWAVVIVNLAFFIYTLCFTGGINDILLSPMGNYVKLSDMTPARVTYLIACIHLHSAWCFPVAMTLMLSIIIAYQFKFVTDRLRRTLRDSGEHGISDGELEEIRQQHEMLCRSVERADKFLRIYYLAAFFGPLITVILLLYILIFFTNMLQNNPVLIFIYTFWLISGTLQLSLTCASGVIVNHNVRKQHLTTSLADF
jgi:hypothetical protein